MASATKSYYCYQCSDRVPVDMFTVTCSRCGGGFVQEMPEERPPQAPLIDLGGAAPEPQSSTSITGSSAPIQQNTASYSNQSVGGFGALPSAPRPGFTLGSRPRFGVQVAPPQSSGIFSPGASYGAPPPMAFGFNGGVRQQSPPQHHHHPQPQFFLHQTPPPPPQQPFSFGPNQSYGFMPAPMYQQQPQQQQPPMANYYPGQMGGHVHVAPSSTPHHHHQHPPSQVTVVEQIVDVEIMQNGRAGVPRVREVIVSQFAAPEHASALHGHGGGGHLSYAHHPEQGAPYNFGQMVLGGQPHQHQDPHMYHGHHMPQQGGPQNGVLVVGVQGDDGQPPVQNVIQFTGGNMNNLMQLLTENIDDVITAVLNQMGTQGGPPSITQEEVDRIPTKPVEPQMIEENRSCSICLENFKAGESFKDLSCTHQFHGPCIDRWLMIHGNCPICRTHFGPAQNNQDDQQQQQFPVFDQNFLNQLIQNQVNQMHQQMPPQQQQQQPHVHHHSHQHVHQQQPRPHLPFAFQPPRQATPRSQQQQGAEFRGQFGRRASPGASMVFQPAPMPQHGHAGVRSASPQVNQQARVAAPQNIMWSGQVVMNDPAGPSIVLEMQSPHRGPTNPARQNQQQAAPRNIVRMNRMPAQQNMAGNQQQLPQQIPPNLMQNVMNSVSQMLFRPPGAAPPQQQQQHNPSAQNPTADRPSSAPTARTSNTSQPPQNNTPAPAERRPDLTEDLDVD